MSNHLYEVIDEVGPPIIQLAPEGMTAWRLRTDLSRRVGLPRRLSKLSNRWLPEPWPTEHGLAHERLAHAQAAARLRRIQARKAAAGWSHVI